jgi:hypothetical protein
MTNSMQEYLEKDPSFYADEIRLRRTVYNGAFAIVEGSSDFKFYRQILVEDGIVVASNKSMAIEVLKILNHENAVDVVAIVDKDFDELREILPQIDNLFFTDSHDLETLLIQSPALEKVLNEFGSNDKIKNLGEDVRDILLNAGCSIGYLLWVSFQDALHLKFEGIQYGKFLDKTSLKLDENNLMKEVKNRSQQPALDLESLKKQFSELKDSKHDRWQVCRGHDLVEILSVGLLQMLGSRKATAVTSEILERSLRLAYEKSYFSQTKLYDALKTWEIQHNVELFLVQ